MIFTGDIALPYKDAIDISKLPQEFYHKSWVGNLEGALVEEDDNTVRGLYNHKAAIQGLIQSFNYKAFALANNHIFDTGNIDGSISFLDKIDIKHLGIGQNLQEANQEIVLNEDGIEIVIANFGWEVIQCEVTTGDKKGVNPLLKDHVLKTISKLIKKYPNGKVIPFMHWSYELEAEPQPFERELAKKLIDMGVFCVIGCHPHRVGGIEFYKGKPIVYSLGNWLFKQNHYFNGTLKFPAFCDDQLAVEIDFKQEKFLFHFFEMNQEEAILTYKETISNYDSSKIKKLTPFAGLSNKEYKSWYKKNQYHKRKGLPIYYWEDSKSKVQLKNKLNKLRDFAIKVILNKGK